MCTPNVKQVATQQVDFLKVKAGGSLPKTLDGWKWLAWEIGKMSCDVIDNSERRGRLLFTPRGWIISYNGSLPEPLQILVIGHEISEFLSRAGQTTMFDETFAADFDGTGDRFHQVASRVTRAIAETFGWCYEQVITTKAVWHSRTPESYTNPIPEIERVPVDGDEL